MMFAAGFVDSLAGGGGLITLPSYMAFGLNPALLLGTNKLSSCMGTSVAAWKFRRQIKLDKKLIAVMAALALKDGQSPKLNLPVGYPQPAAKPAAKTAK